MHLSENNYAGHCNTIVVRNNYKLFVHLNNNKILTVCKGKIKIVEEYKGRLYHTASNNILISSTNNCKIMINNITLENTHINLTYDVPNIHKSNFKFVNKYINLEQKHFNDFSKLRKKSKN